MDLVTIKELRDMGAAVIKAEGIEIRFYAPIPAPFDAQILEKTLSEDTRQELMGKMSSDEIEKLENWSL